VPDNPTDASIVRAAIDIRRFPWVRPLQGAYAHAFAPLAPLFAGDPADPAAWTAAIARVQAAPRDRAGIARVVGAQLERRAAHAHARGAASRLADPATVAVVTGQQAGLFGGPLYTLLKAVTTIQLARRLAARHGVVAIPVFWIESEDHDWDEVRGCRVLDQDMQVRDVTLGALDGAGTQPVGRLLVNDAIEPALADLAAALPPTEFTEDVLARLRRHYRPGVSLSTAFAAWLDDLLGRHGLVVFDACDRAAKPLVGDLFVQELTHPARTAGRVLEAAALMRSLGHAPQVEPADDAVSLFYLDGQGRRIIRRHGEGFAIGDLERPAADLLAEATAHPERFSPNVLLRPLVQDRLFPTVCYVGGPSELAYQAQLGGVYTDFGVQAPLLYPRASATMLDTASLRFLDKYDMPLEAFHRQDDSALNALLIRQLPAEVEEAFEAAARDITARLEAVRLSVPAIDATLSGATTTTIDKMRETLGNLHNKIVQASKRKDETLRRQFQRTRALAFPGGEPQERALTLAYFVNRAGPTIGDLLIEGLPLDMGQHYIVAL
jgi:bacillithiol biosynthesis cysteine-adding enzyme BshC